jgi:hypothetical protein
VYESWYLKATFVMPSGLEVPDIKVKFLLFRTFIEILTVGEFCVFFLALYSSFLFSKQV